MIDVLSDSNARANALTANTRQKLPPTRQPQSETPDRIAPSAARRVVYAGIALILLAGFMALGVWQLQRRVWKLDLIEHVEQRVHAAPTPAPGLLQWPGINSAADEYRKVEIQGSYLYEHETLVQASTELGSGFWVMTPLRTADGAIVLINRGFVAPSAIPAMRQAEAWDSSASRNAPNAPVITGLLRMSQPGGGFLRHNDAASDRWYSRDVQAIAAARGLQRVAPYFIDADANPAETVAAAGHRRPVGGLTVISFPNNHLVYALTWFALALMTAAAAWRLLHAQPAWREELEAPILREKPSPGEREDGNDGDVR